jgi:hypothetical protein
MSNVAEQDLVAEFEKSPFGPHSSMLQEILDRFRAEPIPDKYVLVCLEPYRQWALARLPKSRGGEIAIMADRIFSSLEDAERTVFALRWERHEPVR